MLNIKRSFLSFVLCTLTVALLAIGCGDDDGPVEPGPPPNIQIFTAAPTDIASGDSSQITYKVADADSVKLYPAGTRLTPVDSGQTWVMPSSSTTYILKAYNEDGRDTADVLVTVLGPLAAIEAVNGRYYKGVMGSESQTPLMQFRALDAGGHPLVLPWMQFELVEGDGTLSADSLQAGGASGATLGYTFDGDMGHARIRAFVRDIDTVTVDVRANAIIPGPGGQAMYVMLDTDVYQDVRDYFGEPDTTQFFNGIHYVEYLSTLQLVVMIEDTAFPSNVLQDQDAVYGVIFDTNFVGARTADSIGIGSTRAEFEAAYGVADSSWLEDSEEPFWQAYRYFDEGLLFFTSIPADADAIVRQMNVYWVPYPGTIRKISEFDSPRARRGASVLEEKAR